MSPNRNLTVSDYLKKSVKREKLNIALLVDEFSKGHGPARVVELQAKELSAKGHNITIFALNSDMDPPADVKLEIIGTPNNKYLRVLHDLLLSVNFWKCSRWSKRLKDFDVMIAHQHYIAWISLLSKKLYGTKFVYYNHPVVSEKELFDNLYYKLFMKINEKLHRFIAKKANFVISVSEYARRTLEEAGVRSTVIYNPIDHSGFHRSLDGEKIRKELNLGNSPIILFVGRIVPSKKIGLLIKVFKKVKEEIPNANLLIIGKSPFEEYLKKLKEMSKPYTSNVLFLGYVPDEELPYYYVACDVYATTSFHEGFNLPIGEAQACGKPVVAFDIGSHREVVKNGYLVERGNTEEFSKRLIKLLRVSRRGCQYG